MKTQDVTIDGVEYRLSMMGTRKALAAELVAGRIFGELVKDLIAGANPNLIEAFLVICKNTAQESMAPLVDALAEHTKICQRVRTNEGKDAIAPVWLSLDWDEHFAGRQRAFWTWLQNALAFQFADFLGGKTPSPESPAPAESPK